jgi:hypothetical protein
MTLTQESRRLTHLKAGNISFSRTPPSVNSMSDGDIVFSIVGSTLGLYVKLMGKLWFTEMKDVNKIGFPAKSGGKAIKEVKARKEAAVTAFSGAGNLTFKSGSTSALTATQDAWLRVKIADNINDYFIPAFTDDVTP